ncbi:MAG: hypothetical protein EBU31_09340 [Proteobacteria bacterium]|nr:hypothetical protein [Pseudomonadota bacterium]
MALQIVAKAAARCGVPKATVDRWTVAMRSAQQVGVKWAGSKRAFELLSANISSGADGRFISEHRRKLFEGGMHVWGMRASIAFRVDVVAPDARRKFVDCATVRGFVGLERLRFDAAWRLESPTVIDDRCRRRAVKAVTALAPSDRSQPPFLIPSLCSPELPELHASVVGQVPSLELGEGEVGRASVSTVVHGALLRRVQPIGAADGQSGIFQVFKLRTPSEAQVMVFAVHRSLLEDGAQPDATVYGDLNAAPERSVPYSLGDRLHCGVSLSQLPKGIADVRVEGVPLLASFLEDRMRALGWDPRAFKVFRAAVEYPPIPSSLALDVLQPGT